MQAIPHPGSSIGFIGAGRVGTALALALARAGFRVVAVASRSRTKAEALASALPSCECAAQLQRVADAADLVFLTVPDDAIGPVSSAIRWREGQAAVHCSGAAELDVLEGAAKQGARTGAFHPLQLFADPETALRGLSSCAIAVEAAEPLRGELERLVRALGARLLHVPPGRRAAYHAASHYAAAFLCVLLAEGEKILREIGIDGAEAGRALHALARGTLEAVEQHGPEHAMAGAYSRGDIGTAGRHVQALDSLGGEVGELYRQLARRSIAVAVRAGRIDERKAEAMRALLRE
jgi:predicted short-subunit dehydrogenase-like oxidoreductase (DUF2520 family)